MGEQRIGKYVIKAEIGRGAMGVVYKAVDPIIGRTVAIKTVRFDLLADPGQREEAQRRFEREAQSAGGLSHPNIVTIYDIGESEGTTFIAMEFVEGESLESLLASGVRWDAASAARFAVQMGEALDLAHRKGIVHRDIKPGNILVDAEGRPHIVDFGIARIASSTMTQTNMVMGTPYYMSPEQVAGRQIDQRADIFSLGAVLYEMLTREKAFPGETLTTVIYKIMNESPAPIRQFRADIPGGIAGIIEKTLAKDPAARYASCREMIADLRPFLTGQVPLGAGGGTAGPVSATVEVSVPKKPAIRKSRERKGIGSSPAPLGGAGNASAVAAPQGGAGRVNTAAETNRKKLLLVVGLMMALVVVIGGVIFFSSRKPGPNVIPPAGTFNVVFSDKAVQDHPSAKEAGDSRPEPKPAVESAVSSPVMETAPPQPAGEQAKRTEVLVDTKTGESRQEAVPPPAGKPDNRELPVPAKDEPASPAAPAAKGGTRLPRLLRQIDPVYPPDALRERIDGEVALNLTVGFSGRVERAVIVKSVPKLDAAAVTAALKWEFEPGLLEGIPIQATLPVTIRFTLPPEPVKPKSGLEAGKDEPQAQAKTRPAEPAPAAPQDDLARLTEMMNREAFGEALAAASKFLAANPNHAQAKAIALDAVIRLAPGEIKALLDQYALSYKAGQPAEFFRTHARPDIYERLRGDLDMMMSATRDVQVSVSGLNLDFQMARFPEFQTRAVFSQIMTGIPAAKLTREVMFEGRYSWVLERRGSDWVIVSVKVE